MVSAAMACGADLVNGAPRGYKVGSLVDVKCPSYARTGCMHQILIVDEEEHLLWALEKNLIPERPDIRVVTASDGERGLEWLRNERIDVLICDIKMPGKVDGFQLILRAKEIAPDARVVIMTAFGANRIQNLAERVGITHYIEKPFNIGDLRDVVLELLDAKEGFQGVLSDLELTDIIQMLCLAKRTAMLHLKHRERRGKIVFEVGDVVHAEFAGESGEEAVYRMLGLRQGDIYMQSDFEATARTIECGWQDLLLEGVRRADEWRADEESDAFAGPRPARQDTERGPMPGDDDAVGLAKDTSNGFFTQEELAEIEAGDAIETSRGFGPGVSESSLPGPVVPGLEEMSQPIPGRKTESSEYDYVPERVPTEPRVSVVAHEIVAGAERVSAHESLRAFARECADLGATGVFSLEDGVTLDFVTRGAAVDPDVMSAYFRELFACAGSIFDALRPGESCVEAQLVFGRDLVLLRALPGTPYVHVALLERSARLGIALVLMRRWGKVIGAGFAG